MLIPYGTDAPVYHLPFATVGMIIVNTVVSFTAWSACGALAWLPKASLDGSVFCRRRPKR